MAGTATGATGWYVQAPRPVLVAVRPILCVLGFDLLIVSGTTPELYGDAILATLFVSLLLNVGAFFSFRVLARGKHKVV